jgi:hypothetical protein
VKLFGTKFRLVFLHSNTCIFYRGPMLWFENIFYKKNRREIAVFDVKHSWILQKKVDHNIGF